MLRGNPAGRPGGGIKNPADLKLPGDPKVNGHVMKLRGSIQ
jgi:hypothetical protein